MKFFFTSFTFCLLIFGYSFSQIETKPLEKKIEIDKKSNSILKLPKIIYPTILKKISFLKNQFQSPKGFENNIQMENTEAFINPDAYLKKLNSNKLKAMHQNLRLTNI